MDGNSQKYIRNCFQTTLEIQNAINRTFVLGYKLLIAHSIIEERIQEPMYEQMRTNFSLGYEQLISGFDFKKKAMLQEKLDEVTECAIQIREFAKKDQQVKKYVLDCFQEMSEKQDFQ